MCPSIKKIHKEYVKPCGIAEELLPADEFYFQWHITEQCNQRCAHCYHESYDAVGELSLPQLTEAANRMLAAIHKWGKRGSFSLTGGEPFLRKRDLFSIAHYLDDAVDAHYYDILTNGSLIDDEVASELCSLAKLRRIQVSLEGASAESNDSVRGPGSFKETIGAIRCMKKAGLELSVMTTLTFSNAQQIPLLIEMLEGEGVDNFAIERFIPEGQGKCMVTETMTSDEVRQVFMNVHRLGCQPRPIRVLMYRPLFCLLDIEDETVGAMCSVGNNALTIMHDGTVFPCRRLPIPIGNILSDSLFQIWYDSPLLWQIRNPANLKGKCGRCDYLPICRGCRAAAFAHTGDYLAEDPQCWK